MVLVLEVVGAALGIGFLVRGVGFVVVVVVFLAAWVVVVGLAPLDVDLWEEVVGLPLELDL
jgi:4-amino-4-deoxy-L-arabinose transferase-like glycosyltransferase